MTLFFFRSVITSCKALLCLVFFNPFLSANNPNSSIYLECPSDLTVGVYGSSCSATVTLPAPTIQMQGCPSNPIMNVSAPFGQGLGPHPNVPVGTYIIDYQVLNSCGDTASCQMTLYVLDKKKPVAVLNTALYSNLNTDGFVRMQAWQCNQSSYDNCTGASDLRFSFSDSPTDTIRKFTCAQVGMNTLEVWVWDAVGNFVKKTTQIGILDASSMCEDASLGGNISTEAGRACEGLVMQAIGTNTTHDLKTDENGDFFFESDEIGENFNISPAQNNDVLNGVNSYDLFLIQQHLAEVDPFDSPFQYIAADINKDQELDNQDLDALQAVILGVEPSFENNKSWRFIDKTYVFNNTAPLLEPFPESITLNKSLGEIQADFIAVKTGDLNLEANTGGISGGDEDRSTSTKPTFYADFKGPNLIEIRLDLFENIVALDCILNFDRPVDDFEIVGNSNTNFKSSLFSFNQIKISWYHTDGAQLPELTILIHLTTDATTPLQDIVSLDAASNQAFGKGDIMYRSNLKFASAYPAAEVQSDVIRAFQNIPNPFMEFTLLPFIVAQESDVSIKIFDQTGSLVCAISGKYAQGEHRVLLLRDELPNPGIYTCRYETQHGVATRKLMMF